MAQTIPLSYSCRYRDFLCCCVFCYYLCVVVNLIIYIVFWEMLEYSLTFTRSNSLGQNYKAEECWFIIFDNLSKDLDEYCI